MWRLLTASLPRMHIVCCVHQQRTSSSGAPSFVDVDEEAVLPSAAGQRHHHDEADVRCTTTTSNKPAATAVYQAHQLDLRTRGNDFRHRGKLKRMFPSLLLRRQYFFFFRSLLLSPTFPFFYVSAIERSEFNCSETIF